MMFTGMDAKLIIFDVINKTELVLIDDTSEISPSLYIARGAAHIKGTGYVVLKEFDTNISNF